MSSSLIDGPPPQTVAEVIAVLEEIDRTLPDTDGVKWFNFLYLEVTREIAASMSSFRKPQWVAELDVVFANLYLAAYKAAAISVSNAPAAWRPLFLARHDSGIFRIQYALAGMNAHINRDLPVALREMARRAGGYPQADDDEFVDYRTVNTVLAAVEERVKEILLAGLPPSPGLADVLAMWSVTRARDAAWHNGEVLWQLRITPVLADVFLETLDEMVGLAGRGLLVRTELTIGTTTPTPFVRI